MVWFISKIVIAGTLISLASWLADKKPVLAGFIIAFPIISILALTLNYLEFQNTSKSVTFAKSIFLAVPLSMFFFIPFLFAEKLKLSFGYLMVLGFLGLTLAFFIHKLVFSH
jgi:hypothetical protein